MFVNIKIFFFSKFSVPSKANLMPFVERRKYKQLPVTIVEDHNHVIAPIYKSIGSRHLPVKGNVLIHFDSHPDLLVDKQLTDDVAHCKERLLEETSIENWILPGCYTELYSEVWWIKPTWASQISEGSYDVPIGLNENSFIRVGSDLYYFISDGIMTDKKKLREVKNFQLNVITRPGVSELISKFSQLKEGWILDIDLDYFSTKNPFLSMFADGNLYEKLKPIFSFDYPKKDITYQLAADIALQRSQQLDILEKTFSCIQKNGDFELVKNELPSDIHEKLDDVIEIVNTHYKKNEEFDWSILFNAGLTLDDAELPHHVTTDDHLTILFTDFSNFLKSLPTSPTIVTVARSSEDDYCPKDQVDNIQTEVLRILENLYGTLNITETWKMDK